MSASPAELPLAAPVVSTAPGRRWHVAARRARLLAWLSLAWMTAEGAIGIAAGARADSTALIGWGLGSVIEGLAAILVIWRFTGTRTHSATAERRATRGVAVSFFLLAPYIAAQAVHGLAIGERPSTSLLGIAVTASSIILMPGLGLAKRRLGAQLGSEATAGEGTQNLLCAAQGAGVLAGLAANSILGAWWLDGVVALALAAIALREGMQTWQGHGCCAPGPPPTDGADCDEGCCAHTEA